MNSNSISPLIHENINGKLPDFDYQKKCARNIEVDNRELIDYLILHMRKSDKHSDVGLVLSESVESNEINSPVDSEVKATDVFVAQVKPFSCAYEAKFKVNDQIIQINTSVIYCKGQVFRLLSQNPRGAVVHVLRPQYSITVSSKCKKTERKLYFNKSKPETENETETSSVQQLKPGITTNYPNFHSNVPLQQYLLQSLLEKKRNKNKTDIKESISYNNTNDNSSEWIVRRRSNGERYITKRNRRNDEKSPRRRLLLPGRYVTSEGIPDASSETKSMRSEPCDSSELRKHKIMFENLLIDDNLISILTI